VIDFRLTSSSGVPAYLQIVHQVQQAIRLGLLHPGDQLPTVKDVVARLAINPNTVLKAYRELEHAGLVLARRGQGTYISDRAVSSQSAASPTSSHLAAWIEDAHQKGLTEDEIVAMVLDEIRRVFARAVA